MNSKHFAHLLKFAAVCLIALLFTGCKEEGAQSEKGSKPGEAQAPVPAGETLKSLSTATLTGVKIQAVPGAPTTKILIAASGPFGSNVVPKTDPVRLVAVIHNASKGAAPENIDVNNGTVNRVEIAQLDTGKDSAVRITIGLDKKTEYRVVPGESALTIEVQNVK